MARLNKGVSKDATPLTYEGTPAARIKPVQQLRRVVMAHMLWEDTFYIDGQSSADIVRTAIKNCDKRVVLEMAIEVREQAKLRHIPLLMVREVARNAKELDPDQALISKTLARVIQRPDELAEFLMIYDEKYARSKDSKKGQPLSAQVKKGLALAFGKFSEYQLAKYNRESEVRLKDVLFFSHAKPKDGVKGYTKSARKEKAPIPGGLGSALFDKVVKGTLETPDTWEVNLSGGKDKKETFSRLMEEGKLGALALLRNLRNMQEAGVTKYEIIKALGAMKTDRVLPFRFIAAARYAPDLEPNLEEAMFRSLGEVEKLKGRTAVLVDVSSSMDSALSGKSEMKAMDAAMGLAILAKEMCEDPFFISFSNRAVLVPNRRGFALRDAIKISQPHEGTDTARAIKMANDHTDKYDRIIIITDEQSHSAYPAPLAGTKAYTINIAAYKNGLGYGRYFHIDGFSEATLKFIAAVEKEPESNE